MVAAAELNRSRPKGGSGTTINLGRITDLDANAEVRGKLWYGDQNKLGLAGQMMADPIVRKSVEAILDPLQAALWDFEPASDDPVDIEAADFCYWNLLEKNNWERVLRLGTTCYVRDGFTHFELTEDNCTLPRARFPNHPGRGLGVGYNWMHHRPANTVEEWIQNPRNPEQSIGVRQWIGGSDVEDTGFREINLERGDLLLRMTWDQEGADFGGLAPLRSAWGAFKSKRLLMIVDMIRHEREGAGVPTLGMPADPTDEEKTTANEILRELRAHEKGFIKLPDGWTFKFTTTNGQSTGLGEAIERCNRDIAFNMGVAWMLLGVAGKTGSWALATEQKGQYALSLDKHARFWESSWNIGMDGWSPIARLVARNYGPHVGVPTLKARSMPTRDWERLLQLLPALKSAGLIRGDATLRAFIRSVTTLPTEDTATADPLPPANQAPALAPAPTREEAEPDNQDAQENAAAIAELRGEMRDLQRTIRALATEGREVRLGRRRKETTA